MRTVMVIVAMALISAPAYALHHSVGGDFDVNFPPAREVAGPDIPDPASTTTPPEGLAISYQNSGAGQGTTFDRTAPRDQFYVANSGVGFFDAVYFTYAGGLQLTLTQHDPICLTIEPCAPHPMTTSPNFNIGMPAPLPGTGQGRSGIMYPTGFIFFYAYLFGDGSATSVGGADYVAGTDPFAGLVDASACDTRTTSCQLITPSDLQGLVTGKPGQFAAVCGWWMAYHFHPGADITTCRDFDFSYASDNPADVGGQSQVESATWVWDAIPGWYGNLAVLPSNGLGVDQGTPTNSVFRRFQGLLPETLHFTVGAALDPAVLDNGGIRPRGGGQLDCLEPGFDVAKVLAHDVDIYDALVPAAIGTVETARDEGNAAFEALRGGLSNIDLGPVNTLVDQVEDAGTQAALEVPRQSRPYYGVDTHGLVTKSEATRLLCIVPEGEPREGIVSSTRGKVTEAEGETMQNWLNVWVWHGVPPAGVAPVRDPIETANTADTHENPGGGATFFFTTPNAPTPGLAQRSNAAGGNVPLKDGFYDNEANFGGGCNTIGFAPICIGDQMFEEGYRAPTSLIWVFKLRGAGTFFNWNTLTSPVIGTFAPNSGDHCIIGASRGVFTDNGAEVTAQGHAALAAMLKRVSSSTILPAVTSQAAIQSTLRGAFCPGLGNTLQYFNGQGMQPHPAGNSLSNAFGWALPTGWTLGGQQVGQLDVFYVLSVDKTVGLTGDKMDLKSKAVGDPTVVSADTSKVTFVWQERTVIGSNAA